MKHISRFDFADPNSAGIHDYENARHRYAQLKGYQDDDALKAALGAPPYGDINGRPRQARIRDRKG